MDHPLVAKAQSVPGDVAAGGADRIRSLADRVWFKVKTRNLRGAVTELGATDVGSLDLDAATDVRWWVAAAGERRQDSVTDFYRGLEAECRRRGSSTHLLPQPIDARRLTAELAARFAVHIGTVVREAVARSLRDGKLWRAATSGHSVGAVVRMQDGSAYLAVMAEGFLDPKVLAVVLGSVPGVAADDWMAEPGEVLGIRPGPGQIVYSTVIPEDVQAALLEEFSFE